MTVTVRHATLTAVADDPAYDVGADEWNAYHTVANAVDKTGDTMTGALAIASGTITANAPALNVTQTWNAGAITFKALEVNVTDTASASGSMLLRLSTGGADDFYVLKGGTAVASYRFQAPTIFLNGNCVLTGLSLSGRKIFAGGFSNNADAFTGGGGVAFTNAAGSTLWGLFEGVSAGLVELNNGTTGTYADLNLRGVVTSPVTVANLPTGVKGMRSFVTDATQTLTAGIGATVAGGGANNVPVVYDGTNWRIG